VLDGSGSGWGRGRTGAGRLRKRLGSGSNGCRRASEAVGRLVWAPSARNRPSRCSPLAPSTPICDTPGGMQKTTSAILGAFVVIATVLVIWRAGPRRDAAVVVPPMGASRTIEADVPAAGSAAVDPVHELEALHALPLGRPGTVLPNGSAPGPLPADAPSEVRFGVILVTYRGAERAPAHARSKEDAWKLAEALAQLAKSDFKAAVEKGDEGSAADLGWIQRGVLEPAPNYVLFTLAPGAVGGPVDTPTGYWVLKNLSK
jgi:hypothetical protein